MPLSNIPVDRRRVDDALLPVVVESLLKEHRKGAPVQVGYREAVACLAALGRPLPMQSVHALGVPTFTLGGKSVASLQAYVDAADELIRRQSTRPNLKALGAAKARAARAAKAAR